MENRAIKKERAKYPRVRIIDAARGFSVVLMVMHHLAFDLVMYQIIPAWLLDNRPFFVVQTFFGGLFIAISGMSSFVSRGNLKRGLQILSGGMAVTLVTWLFDREMYVRFGILHFLGSAAIIYALAGKCFHKIPRKISLPLIIVLFSASLPFAGRIIENPYLFAFNLLDKDFVSADFYPLLPWIFVYFFGAWLAKPVFERRMPGWFYDFSSPIFEFIGKKTLVIYLFHQPVCMGLALLIYHFTGPIAG